MKGGFKYMFFILLSLFVSACGDDSPGVYSSISGGWRCEEFNSYQGNLSYLVDFERSQVDTTQYALSNFYSIGDREYIMVRLKSGKLTLVKQPTTNITVKSFSGTLVGTEYKRIELSYTINDGIRDVSATAVYTRN